MTRRFVLVVAFVLLAAVANAQGVEVRFYFVPKVGTGARPPAVPDPFRPKYVDSGALGVGLDIGNWSAMDYGAENVFLLAADVTPEQHNALSAQTDVLAVPTLNNAVSALALPTVQAKLEALNLPADWITTGMTYRQVLRGTGTMILIAQRYNGLFHPDKMFTGITLDTRWNELSQAQRDRWRAVGDSFGLDYSGITNTMTLRRILRLLAGQLPGFELRGEVF